MRTTLHTLLGIDSQAALTLHEMQWLKWGQSLVFTLSAGDARYTLRFDDCRDMRWRIYAHETDGMVTPVVDFAPGRDMHRSPAQLLTAHFGLSLVYGAMTVSRL